MSSSSKTSNIMKMARFSLPKSWICCVIMTAYLQSTIRRRPTKQPLVYIYPVSDTLEIANLFFPLLSLVFLTNKIMLLCNATVL